MFEIVTEAFNGDVKVISSPTFEDERGFLSVPYQEKEMLALGLPKFVRELHSRSAKNVIRGLHYQNPPMGKLIRVTRGSAFMVAVDIDLDSPTFLQYHIALVDDKNRYQIWAPGRFARGFCALEDNTEVQYKCDSYRGEEKVLRWDSVGIKWPTSDPILSAADRSAQTTLFKETNEYHVGNPKYGGERKAIR
jgi:dTDP-4-dehydrorhamnose 3,5-epimerase